MKLGLIKEQVANRKLLDKLLDDNVKRLYNLYSGAGYEMRIVGGAVRDILSGQTPKDIDLASDATPDESMTLLRNNGITVIDVQGGQNHGVVVAHMSGEDYEIATLRIDKETDGRHAKVEFTRNWEEDAARRDLTFNAMSMDFDGKIYDYFGGRDDLEKGTARFVGNPKDRIEEDFLRILRYFRFQGRVETPKFDKDTLKQIKDTVAGLKKVSGERIGMEMRKILAGKHLDKLLPAMKETEVFRHIGMERPNLSKAIEVSGHTNDPSLIIAALASSPSVAVNIKRAWRLNNEESRIIEFITNHRDDNTKPEYLYFVHRHSHDLVKKLLEYKNNKEKLNSWDQLKDMKLPVTGNDLSMLSGPDIGKALAKLSKIWVDSSYTLSKQELLDKL